MEPELWQGGVAPPAVTWNTHVVAVLCDPGTGRVLFWHKSRWVGDAQNECAELWGRPIGASFGTLLEIWFVDSRKAWRFWPTWPAREGGEHAH